MVISDLLRLALMLGLALVAVAHLPIVLAPVIAALATTAGTPYLACVSGTTPRIIRDADLPGANAARSAVASLGVMAGPALGGVLLIAGSPALAFVVNAATFGVAVACTLAIRDRNVFAVSGDGSGGGLRGTLASVPRGIADGAAALGAHPAAIRLVGADLMCSLVYGMQTVMFILVARQAGLGLHGYGYLFAALGVGAMVGTALAGRVLRLQSRLGLALAMGLVGLSMMALPAVRLGVIAILLAGVSGTGAILVEVMTETGLQRLLPDDVFGRAYGLAIPASIGGIAVGSLIAPVLVSTVSLSGAQVISGAVAVGYGLQLLAGRRHATPVAPRATPVGVA
jgi:predicted MFS family arabinose efflux permease